MASNNLGKGFGARYGPRLREKYGRIAKEQRKLHKCPYCGYEKAKRKAVGIWECSKCDSTFTSKAYTVSKLAPIRSSVEEEVE